MISRPRPRQWGPRPRHQKTCLETETVSRDNTTLGLGLVSSLENLVTSGVHAACPKMLYNPSTPDTISLPIVSAPLSKCLSYIVSECSFYNLLCHSSTQNGKYLYTYKCKLCKEAFASGVSRKMHMKSHTGEKLHKCEPCHGMTESCHLITSPKRFSTYTKHDHCFDGKVLSIIVPGIVDRRRIT